MIIHDRLYGRVEITEPVLIELINSQPVQRLKGVKQFGAFAYINKNAQLTRYEHSVGVMLLLRKLGASIEEQIAGLMHDVPHTAFSHVIDYVFDDITFTFHEQHHRDIIENSEIPKILEKYNIEQERILDPHGFGLLERDAPDLCADRVDYGMRDGMSVMGINNKRFVNHFVVHDGQMVMDDLNAAVAFAQAYMQADKGIWANPESVVSYEVLARILRTALNEQLITYEDLWKTDDALFAMLKISDNAFIQSDLELLENFGVELVDEDGEYEPVVKVRYIDPPVLIDGSLIHASELSEELRSDIQAHKDWHQRGYKVRLVQTTLQTQ